MLGRLCRSIENRGAPLRIGVYSTAMELMNNMGVDQKVSMRRWTSTPITYVGNANNVLNSAKLVISLNQLRQRSLSETGLPKVEPSTISKDDWKIPKLSKIGHLEDPPQLDAPGASKHPANKAARKPAAPGSVGIWASKNYPGCAFRKSARSSNQWINGLVSGKTDRKPWFWNQSNHWMENLPINFLCLWKPRNILGLSHGPGKPAWQALQHSPHLQSLEVSSQTMHGFMG